MTAPEPPTDEAAYWRDRFLRMRAMYRERYNEGLSTEEWHRKHCGLMGKELTDRELAAIIRNAISLNDPSATAQWMRDHLNITRRTE